jgi:hypothetical protein
MAEQARSLTNAHKRGITIHTIYLKDLIHIGHVQANAACGMLGLLNKCISDSEIEPYAKVMSFKASRPRVRDDGHLELARYIDYTDNVLRTLRAHNNRMRNTCVVRI